VWNLGPGEVGGGGVSVATGDGGLLGSVASSEATMTPSSTTISSTMSGNEESVETTPQQHQIIMIANQSQVCQCVVRYIMICLIPFLTIYFLFTGPTGKIIGSRLL
jgi:hypothetical protein